MLDLEPYSQSQKTGKDRRHSFERGNRLRRFISENRIPTGFIDAYTSSPFEAHSGKSIVFCFLPPRGTKPGDLLTGNPIDEILVQSPNGEIRGKAAMFTMTPSQARRIKAKLAELLNPTKV